MELFFQAVGVAGSALIILAYFMQQTGRWSVQVLWYHLCNLVGALAIIVSLTHEWNLPQFVLEVFWAGITIIGLYRWHRSKAA